MTKDSDGDGRSRRSQAKSHRLQGVFLLMAEIMLTQAQVDALMAMKKHAVDEAKQWEFPLSGEQLVIPLISPDKRENFLLDVLRSRIVLTKITYQNRARQAVILMRLDLGGAPHRNPDQEEVACPHLHIYREGYGDKWAIPPPAEFYPDPSDLLSNFYAFMKHCNITVQPSVQAGLFTLLT
jgi:hypothetical protein